MADKVEYHNLCDACGDLLIREHIPAKGESVFCNWCETEFPKGLKDGWRSWPKDGPPDWAGCA